MNSQKSKIQNNKFLSYLLKNKSYLLYSLIISFVFFGLFSRINYTTDTYADIMGSFEEISYNFLGAGRFFTYLLYLIYKVGFSFNFVYYISFIIAIFATALSVYILGKFLQKTYSKTNKILPFLLATIVVINPFTIELLFYFEKGIMISAILFAILGAIAFREYYVKKNKRTLFLSFVFALLCSCSYQGIVGLYLILCVAFILLDSESIAKIIKLLATCATIYILAIILNLLLAKMINGATKSGISNIDIVATIKMLANGSIRMIGLYNIVPASIVYGLLVVAYISYVKHSKKISYKSFNLKLIFLIVVTIGVAVLPYISQSSNNIWFVPRSSFPFAAGLFVMLSFIVLQKNVSEVTFTIATLACLIVLSIEFSNFNQVIINHYQVNAVDKTVASQINNKIVEFEKSNNTKITTATIVYDKNISYTYPETKTLGDVQTMAFATPWSDINALNYYTGNHLEKTAPSDSDRELCLESDTIIPDIIFTNENTILICKH